MNKSKMKGTVAKYNLKQSLNLFKNHDFTIEYETVAVYNIENNEYIQVQLIYLLNKLIIGRR